MGFNIHQILLSSSRLTVIKSKESARMLPPLQKGQLVQATVLKPLSGRQAQLIILGKTITARTHTPLKAGDTILLRVTKASHPPVFKIQQPEDGLVKTLFETFKTLGKSGPFKHLDPLFPQQTGISPADRPESPIKPGHPFVQLLRQTALQSDRLDPALLKRMIQTSGLMWETKLSALADRLSTTLSPADTTKLLQTDLKALARQSSQTEGLSHTAQNALRSFAESLEHLQLINRQLWDESGRFLLPLPMLFEGFFTFGQLLLDLKPSPENQSREKRTIRVSFLLELSQVGELLAEFSILKKQIIGSFGVARVETQALIQENLPELESKLRAHGFDVAPVQCRVLGPETLAGTSLIDQAVLEAENSVLNIVI